MIAVIVLAVLVAVVVARPLMRSDEVDRREDARRAALEAAKEAKYREIHDAELDFRMGKLSDADWHAIDRELRDDAIDILRRLDRVRGEAPDQPLT